MRRRLLPLLLATVATAGPALASGPRYAADFLDIGVGARSLGMGGTGTSTATGPTAILWNPARIDALGGAELRVHHSFYQEGLADLDYVGYVRDLGSRTAVALSLTRFAVDGIPYLPALDPEGEADRQANVGSRPTGEPDGTFGAQDLAFHLAVARRTERVVDFGWLYSPFPFKASVGAGLRYVRQELADNMAVGLGGDAGFAMEVGVGQLTGFDVLGTIQMALAATDIAGTRITWDTPSRSAGDIPFRLRGGLGYVQPIESLGSTLALSADRVWDLSDGARKEVALGAELHFRDALGLRVGRRRDDLTAGVGIRWWKVDLDYALVTGGAAPSHRIDLAFFSGRER